MIPEAAVEAAEAVLLGYTGACSCHEGYLGRNLIDPDCSYHDVSQEVARLILEAAAPHIAAEAWEQGMQAMYETTSSEWPPIPDQNPYR